MLLMEDVLTWFQANQWAYTVTALVIYLVGGAIVKRFRRNKQ